MKLSKLIEFNHTHADGQGFPIPNKSVKFVDDEFDNEGEMAKSQMIKTMRYAAEIMSMIDDTTQLPSWVQSKLTKIADYIGAVKHYMESKTVRHVVTTVNESTDNVIKDEELEKVMINAMKYMLSDLKAAKLNKPMKMSDGSMGTVKNIIGNYDDVNGIYFRIKLDDGKWYTI